MIHQSLVDIRNSRNALLSRDIAILSSFRFGDLDQNQAESLTRLACLGLYLRGDPSSVLP